MDTSSLVSTTTSIQLLEYQSHYDKNVNVVDTNDDASMDGIYVTYVYDEHVDNHDYDDNTEDDHDSNNDINGRACNARVNTSIILAICGAIQLPSPGILELRIASNKMIILKQVDSEFNSPQFYRVKPMI